MDDRHPVLKVTPCARATVCRAIVMAVAGNMKRVVRITRAGAGRCTRYLVMALLGSIGVALHPAMAHEEPTLEVYDAWIRAMPPMQKMTAAYLKVTNHSDRPITVMSVRSPLGDASLHETRVEGGRSTMRAVDTLRVAAGETLEFTPGALHIMLMGLVRSPVEGDFGELCLQSDAGDFCVDARVQRNAGPGTDSALFTSGTEK